MGKGDSPETLSLDPQARPLMDGLIKALRAGDGESAARHFVALVERDSGLRRIDLSRWLDAAIGAAARQRLVRAFARHPCMGCERGLTICEECQGKGRFAAGGVCERCTGFGATNCGFCVGSGWMTYSFVPEGLRTAVVLDRTKLVLAAEKTLLEKPVPKVDPKNAAAASKRLAGHAAQVNRYLGALNNSVEVALHPPLSDAGADPTLEKIRTAALREAKRLEERLRRVLAALVKLYKLEAGRATGPAAELANRRAAFYERTAESADFAGTSLYHVYLHEPGSAPPIARADES